MPVYVDDMYKHPMGQFRRMKMSHMIANTEAELHAMADAIGIDRKWYQHDHYDVSITMRKAAIKNGAIEISMRQLVAMCRMIAKGWWSCTPSQACIMRFGKDYPLSDGE